MRNMLIYAKYLQKNDVFRESNERPGETFSPDKPSQTVLKVTEEEQDFGLITNAPINMRVVTKEGEMVLPSGMVVELLHRPEPQGNDLGRKAEELAEEFALRRSFSAQDEQECAIRLHGALEALLLAKPLESR